MEGLGGPAAFAQRLGAALQERGVAVTHDLADETLSAVLVVGGTRHLYGLWRARHRGVRVVQRLNGMNWVHRQTRTGLRHFWRAEINNLILATIRGRLGDRIIYQSHFTRDWWRRVYGEHPAPSRVIHNGVDLVEFSPQGEHSRPPDHTRILMVEGRFGGGYHIGLENGAALVQELNRTEGKPRYELMVAGMLPPSLRQKIESGAAWVTWAGVVPRGQIPTLDRSAHIFFSADLNAACPNAVIEALACGLPVAAYATGALPEMLQGGGGVCVPYGSDPWKLQPPVVAPLAEAVRRMAASQDEFRSAARARAESAFDIRQVMQDYLDVLLG